jgi:predicted CoA-binding protein
MTETLYHTAKKILDDARIILLVDWANESIPKSLIKAGFSVFSYSPGRFSAATLLTGPGEKENLVFADLDKQPLAADIVYVYRPAAEHAAIIAEHVLPLNAKVLWLHPPLSSTDTTILAAKNGLVYIEGANILDII